MLLIGLSPTEVESIGTFPNDPGFGFNISTTSISNNITSELRVTAARDLDGVTVECEGFSETFMSNIQVALGESGVGCKRSESIPNSHNYAMLQIHLLLQVESCQLLMRINLLHIQSPSLSLGLLAAELTTIPSW